MQVQLDHIAGSICLLRQGGEEELVHDAHRDLLPCGMRGHNHTAGHALGSHRDLGAIVKAAHRLAFRALLQLIGG